MANPTLQKQPAGAAALSLPYAGSHPSPASGTAPRRSGETRWNFTAGQRGAVAPLVAILMPVLLLAVALSLDIGMALASKAQLQRAVDAAALSAAETLVQPGINASTVARQVLGANGIAGADLLGWDVTFPMDNTVRVEARRRTPVYFLRAASTTQSFTVAAAATADVNSYAEVPIKPTGNFGKIQQTNPAVFGPDAWHSRGDAYSTQRLNDGSTNPDYARLPYGYLFRIDVPPTYTDSQLTVELFDPDSYNAVTYGGSSTVDGSHAKEDTYIQLNAFGAGWHRFYRVDEMRAPWNSGASTCNLSGGAPLCSSWATTTRYTLWHFDPSITNAFVDPATIGSKIAEVEYGYNTATDLTWVKPSGFTVTLSNYPQERDGGWYFYIYVKSVSGSSENNFDIRTGPPGQTEEADVNDQQNHTWNSGGSTVYAKRAYPMNNADQGTFWVYLTQVPANAAGQQLQVRHFDNDGNNTAVPYYLERPDGTNVQIATGALSGNDSWYPTSSGAADLVQLPDKSSAIYSQVYPAGRNSAWLKAQYPLTIGQDTSVWELIYIRPRLIQ